MDIRFVNFSPINPFEVHHNTAKLHPTSFLHCIKHMRNHITINLVFYDRTHVKNNTLFPQDYDMKLIVRLEVGFIIFMLFRSSWQFLTKWLMKCTYLMLKPLIFRECNKVKANNVGLWRNMFHCYTACVMREAHGMKIYKSFSSS